MKSFVIALLMAAPLHAQTVSVSSTVTWTPPTTDSNGIPLNTAGDPNVITGYNIYESATPLTATPATATATAPATATSATVLTPSATVGSTLNFYVTACDSTGCSPLSAAATKAVVAPGAVPNSPTNTTVTTTITTIVTTTTNTATPAK